MDTESRRETRAVAWLFAAALALRIGYVALYPQFPFGMADDRAYDELGWSLASGTGFTLATGPARAAESGASIRTPAIGLGPTYPVFLALVYGLFGHDITAVRLVQALVSAVLVLLVWHLARAAGYPSETAMVSAGLVAFYPAFIIYSGVVLTEMLFAFFLVVSIWATLRALETRSNLTWMFAGAVMGATILLRFESILVVPAIAAVWAYRSGRPGGFRHLLLFFATVVLVVGPWTARNYLTFGELVPVAAGGGRTLWISAKGWDEWVPDGPELQTLTTGLSEVEIDRVLGEAAIRDIMDAPGRYLLLCIRRIAQFWVGSHTTYLVGFTESFRTYVAEGAYGRVLVKMVLLLGNLALILIAMLGAVRAVVSGRQKRADLLLIPILALATVHFFFFATSRYQVPIMPFVLVFAAVGLARYLPAPGLASVQSAPEVLAPGLRVPASRGGR